MKKLTRKNLDELTNAMPVISEQDQRSCVGGAPGDILDISGGYLIEMSGGTVFFGENGFMTFYRDVTFSTKNVVDGAAYQLNGVIHISDSWVNNGFSNDDFAHEYDHFLQQQEMGTAAYLATVVIPSVWSAWTDPENHANEPFEIDATERGMEYKNNNTWDPNNSGGPF